MNADRRRCFLVVLSLVAAFSFALSLFAQEKKKAPLKPLDLNAAPAEDLQKLPEVGPKLAAAIVRFRERSGPFRRVEELLTVPGITKRRLEKMRPFVIVTASQVRASDLHYAEESVRRFLQDYTAFSSSSDMSTRYVEAFVDLNNDGKDEVIVYLTGPQWCGSGGCTALILRTEGTRHRILTKLTVVNPPLRVLATISNGWHSLSAWVQGGGIVDGYEAILNFDGQTYPSNPTVAPAQRARQKAIGKEVIERESMKAKALWP